MKNRSALGILWIIACLCAVLFAGRKLYDAAAEYRAGTQFYGEAASRYARPSSVQSLPAGTEPEAQETAPISVDFDALSSRRGDVVGWLYCEETPVNYPIAQSDDNDYYLYRLLDGTPNTAGTLFLDCRASGDFSGWNSVIYGHNMKNDSMFGSLKHYRAQAYYDSHPVLYLLTPNRDYKIELVGGYVTSSNAAAYSIPETREERDALVRLAVSSSTFTSSAEITDNDKLITLSTCVYDFENARYVLVGVLRPLDTPASLSP